MTATFLPVRVVGGSATIQPSSKPLSTMAFSMFLMVTGGALMPSTHEPSHGAGHTRPGELRKVVGAMQAVERLAPQAAKHQVVPLRE